MRHLLLPAIFILSACSTTTTNAPLESDDDKMAYAIGHLTGKMFQGLIQEQQLDKEQFFEALRVTAEMREDDLRMSEDDIAIYSKMHEERLLAAQKERRTEEALKNEAEGLAYRDRNASSEAVQVLESGLQYEVLENNGNGNFPKKDDVVVVHYKGTFVDGTEFDSSFQRGSPASFNLNRMIQGWQIALPLMQVGEKWRIVLPPELAYGEAGQGSIGPNQTLVFEIDLLEIEE